MEETNPYSGWPQRAISLRDIMNHEFCLWYIQSSIMPKGQDYSIKEKQIFFRVIDFVEKEKAGPTIPLQNTTDRLLAMLGIGETSLFRLKKELTNQRQKQQDEQEKQLFICSRRRTASSNESARLHRKRCWSTASYNMSSAVPAPLPSYKKDNSGRPAIHLSKLPEDTIRYHFRLLLVSSKLLFVASH